MQLYYQKYPESYSPELDSREPVVIIPGLFGSVLNWRGFAVKLAEHHPVIVVDQRNHGRSPHADSHTYFDMLEDLLELLDSLALGQVHLCGHSMGGKVAMAFSLQYPDRLKSLAVLDIAPVEYTHTHAPYLESMIALDLNSLDSRSAADKLLSSSISDTPTRLFLLQSLAGSKGNFSWRLNLPVLLRDMPNILSFPSSQLDGLTNTGETVFISGDQSDYVKEIYHNQILRYFPATEFSVVPDAGHWLHVEQPQAVLTVLLNFLQFGKKND